MLGQIIGKLGTVYGSAKGWSVFSTGGFIYYQINGGTSAGASQLQVSTSTAYNDGVFHRIWVTYNGGQTAAGVTFYVDGVVVPQHAPDYNTLSTSAVNATSASIGNDLSGDVYAGALDEVVVLAELPSADHILADYNNQHSPSTFYTIGSELTGSGSSSGSVAARRRIIL